MSTPGAGGQANDKSHVEAWKALIDFQKSITSLAAAILTALLGYYVVDGSGILDAPVKYLSPALLVLSIIVSMYGAGRAIRAVKTGASEDFAVLCTNVSVLLLVLGILALPLLRDSEGSTLDDALKNIEKQTQTQPGGFSYKPQNVASVHLNGAEYSIVYSAAGQTKAVVYSTKNGEIQSVR